MLWSNEYALLISLGPQYIDNNDVNDENTDDDNDDHDKNCFGYEDNRNNNGKQRKP